MPKMTEHLMKQQINGASRPINHEQTKPQNLDVFSAINSELMIINGQSYLVDIVHIVNRKS